MYKWTMATLLACVAIKIWNPFLVESLQLNYFDFLQQQHPKAESEQIILVDIDEAAIAEEGQWPWPRQIMAKYIDDIAPNNIVVLNVVYGEEDRFGGDDELYNAMMQKNVILASAPTGQVKTTREHHIGTATLGKYPASDFTDNYPGLILPIEKLSEASMGIGTVSDTQDIDGITRQLPMIVSTNGKIYPSLTLEVLRVAAGDISYQVKTNELGIEWVRIPKYTRIDTNYDGSIYNSYWNTFKRVKLADMRSNELLNGAFVVIGPTYQGSQLITTPLGKMYPHEVQANLLKTLIDGTTIKRPDYFPFAELTILLILGLLILALVRWANVLSSGIVSVLLIGGVAVASWQIFFSSYLLFDPTWIIISLVLVFSHASFVQFYTNFKLRQQIKKQFETYLDPRQVALLQKNPELLKLGGERREMTFLFMDICGFTPISEHYKNNDDPEGLVELVNEFLNRMTNIILKNGGTIDKYMGDCIMAFWNAPLECENHAEMAIKSAIEIEEEINELKGIYKSRNLPDINVGTGVNTGTCIVGNMGSESRFDYSVIGDAVNLAARLEATAGRGEYLDHKTIYSRATMEQLPEGYLNTEIGTIKVKGKEEEIRIYSPTKIG
tara:strand:- start:4223 stop:6055 length:1833 start_codon:yes stop_codon:yes gene_type:complete